MCSTDWRQLYKLKGFYPDHLQGVIFGFLFIQDRRQARALVVVSPMAEWRTRLCAVAARGQYVHVEKLCYLNNGRDFVLRGA